jgi:pimeloyl-ACP methyl ester carboxylesterase
MARTEIEDAVVLLPGFLGFNRFGGFRYFADRVSATLRGALETQLGRPVPVVPFTTLPTSALAARQSQILQLLVQLDQRLQGQVKRFHLVGHSTGGLDAVLLCCTAPLNGSAWAEAPDHEVRKKIRSVTGLAAPYQGTLLLEGPLAHVIHALVPWPKDLLTIARPVVDLLFNLHEYRAVILDALAGAIVERSRFLWYLMQLRSSRLLDDLMPRSTEAYCSNFQLDPRIRLRSFVSVVPPPSHHAPHGDRFFEGLYQLAAGSGLPLLPGPRAEILQAVEALRKALSGGETPIICSDDGALYRAKEAFGRPACELASYNDGVVNSARQLFNVGKNGTTELAGIVIADHGDLIGHYDRKDPYSIEDTAEPSLNEGLFHSNVHFGDDQFFSLYNHVAQEIVNAIH